MVELCMMASHGYPPGLGVVFHPEQSFSRVFKDLHHILPCHSSNQDFNLCLQQKEDTKSKAEFWDFNNHFPMIDSNSKRPDLIDIHGTHSESLHLSFGIAEQCTKQEKILRLLSCGSIEVDGDLRDLSVLYDLLGPEQTMKDFSQQPFASSYSKWQFTESRESLIYPTRELNFNESLLDLVGDWSSCLVENKYYSDGQLQSSCTGTEMNDILSAVSDLYLSKNAIKSSRKAILVPFFERRRRARSNIDSSKLATENAATLKSHEKAMRKTSQKKRTHSRTTTKERESYNDSYLHACESLLSIIVDRKQQQGKSTIMSLKKSGPKLPQLLTQVSATIAGTGIAVLLSVVSRVACNMAPFCAAKLSFGLGLVWLSWAVSKLSDTVITIGKASGKLGANEEEIMMGRLDRNLKDIYFRAAALMAVAVLRFL